MSEQQTASSDPIADVMVGLPLSAAAHERAYRAELARQDARRRQENDQ